MCPQKFARSCKEHVQIFYPPATIYTDDVCRWNPSVCCVIKNLKRLVTCCGLALLQGMSGRYSKEEQRSAAMRYVISSSVQPDATEIELTGFRAIWNARSRFYFEQVQTHPKTILESASGVFEEYQRLMIAQNLVWFRCLSYGFLGPLQALVVPLSPRWQGVLLGLLYTGFLLSLKFSTVYLQKKKKKNLNSWPCIWTKILTI